MSSDKPHTENPYPKSKQLKDILYEIEGLADADNLAAVLIHINDTYFIDERPDSGIPGMPRIAGLVGAIRRFVSDRLGEDRTLLLHSGDYLSPSALSTQFKGQQMVDVMNLCGVNFATIGNHEFDFDDSTLRQRLSEAKFTTLLANLVPPSGYHSSSFVVWPEKDPFLAITGLVGTQTTEKAYKFGFEKLDLNDTVTNFLNKVEQQPPIGTVIVLTHMDREEDKQLQETLSARWHKTGFVYILGGHDHHIHWREVDRGNCLVSKCRSNCQSVTIILLPKDGLASPSRTAIRPHTVLDPPLARSLDDRFDMPDFDTCVDYAVKAYRRVMPCGTRPDFQAAFERRVKEALRDQGGSIRDAVWVGYLGFYTVDLAVALSLEGFSRNCLEISRSEHLLELPVDPIVERRVREWMFKAVNSSRMDSDDAIADFQSEVSRSDGKMDARDTSLRWHSTDFGNFVADCIRAALYADISLINAGSFRIDSLLPAHITESHLCDIFVYDNPRAVIRLNLTIEELCAFYEHAIHKAGHGAFLQVSEALRDVVKRSGLVRTALIRHMLQDGEDGFQGILAGFRKIEPDKLIMALCPDSILCGSLVGLIKAGARQGIRYSNEWRVAGQLSRGALEQTAYEWVDLVDNYLRVCKKCGILIEEALELLRTSRRNVTAFQHCPALEEMGRKLHVFAFEVVRKDSPTVSVNSLYEYLAHSIYIFASGVEYHRFLDRAAEGLVSYGGWPEPGSLTTEN